MIQHIMRKTTDIILKHLYVFDRGNFIEIDKSLITKSSKGVDINIRNIANDLKTKDYVEIEELKDLGLISSTTNIDKSKPLKVRITQKGREYIDEQTIKNKQFNISKRTQIISIISLAISILTFWFLYIQPKIFAEKHEIVKFSLLITNNSSQTIYFNQRDEFSLWLPVGINDGANNIPGKYELIGVNGIDSISSGKSRSYFGQILNAEYFFNFYKRKDCGITLILHHNNGVKTSNEMDFVETNLLKYRFDISIKDK
jgi:hypothetical protein